MLLFERFLIMKNLHFFVISVTLLLDASGTKGPEFTASDSTNLQTRTERNKAVATDTVATDTVDVGHSVRQKSPPG